MLLREPDQLLMRDPAGSDEDHSVGSVVGRDVLCEVRLVDRKDVFLWSEDRTPEGLALECSGVEMVKDDFLELFIDFFLLAQDHVTFALDGGFLEFGVLKDVGEDLDGSADVVFERFGVVDGVFALLGMSALLGSGSESEREREGVQMCRRSNGHPCSQFRVPVDVESGFLCPKE